MPSSDILASLVEIKNKLESEEIDALLRQEPEGIREDALRYRAELGLLISSLAIAEKDRVARRTGEFSDQLVPRIEKLKNKIAANEGTAIALAMLQLAVIVAEVAQLDVSLVPTTFLDADWHEAEPLPPPRLHLMSPVANTPEADLIDAIRASRIEVASEAETLLMGGDAEFDWLKSELGMNIVVPIGKIEEMRFIVKLRGEPVSSDNGVWAVDGFPKDAIDERHIVNGKVTLGVAQGLALVPVIGPALAKMVNLQLK
jgi:hypothetical protein